MYIKLYKRLIDILLSVFGFILISPLFLLVALLIHFEDRGPIFYNANRLGRNGKVFKMYKFRSMKSNAPDIRNEDGSTFNSECDMRVTKIGKIIRKASIDELPQLLNVIKGDMSLIGPRPDLPEALNIYSDVERKKLTVRPGITGYNQAYYRNSNSQSEKFKNDIFYVDNISFNMDFKILFITIKNVLARKNINNAKKPVVKN
ncbi:sugar transferase [Alkalihalobacillus deserti]|uniref:sugar transferase n=1 Tax=Alkalihalobacillus deserti TaxID=2879466 RepID=UPI001D1527E6|nr:sugar transferase [Alkalihalobacillus deserti]